MARLLTRNGLPTDDLPGVDDADGTVTDTDGTTAQTDTAAHDADDDLRLYVAHRDGERVGCGGIERHGDVGLLRSVVVEREKRGAGVGTALCAALVERARANGVASIYLLTTDAADFFTRQGFEPVARETVPDAIRTTTQFTDLCPDSAVVVHRDL